MSRISPYALGATLFVPALHQDIHQIIAGRKYPGLKSVVLCLEDSLHSNDVESGLANLGRSLGRLGAEPDETLQRPLVFVRPRHIEMAREIAAWPAINRVAGFVAPKFRPGQAEAWMQIIAGSGLLLMPILETSEMFDALAVRDLRDELIETVPHRILALRIGGNDLMSCLGLRRSRGTSIYQTPLLYVLSLLSGIFVPAGFAMTSPVYEIIDDDIVLGQESRQDVEFGFVGKTAIHPCHVPLIHNAYKVKQRDHESAMRILDADAAAVFKFHGAMCEPSTHSAWARRIMERVKYHGLADPELQSVAA